MKIVTLTLDKVHIKKERHKRRCRNQKHTYSHTRESHKNTKLRAIYQCIQRTGAELYRPCACCVSLCDFRQLCSVDLEGLFSWCLLSLLALRLFLLSLSLASERSDLLQTNHFAVCIQKSLFLCFSAWKVFKFFPSSTGGRLSDHD